MEEETSHAKNGDVLDLTQAPDKMEDNVDSKLYQEEIESTSKQQLPPSTKGFDRVKSPNQQKAKPPDVLPKPKGKRRTKSYGKTNPANSPIASSDRSVSVLISPTAELLPKPDFSSPSDYTQSPSLIANRRELVLKDEDCGTRNKSDADAGRYLHEPHRGHSRSLSYCGEEKKFEVARAAQLHDMNIASDQPPFSKDPVNIGTTPPEVLEQTDGDNEQPPENNRMQLNVIGRQRSMSDSMDEHQFAAIRASQQEDRTATQDIENVHSPKPTVPPKPKIVLRRNMSDLSHQSAKATFQKELETKTTSDNTTTSEPFGRGISDSKVKKLPPALRALRRQDSVDSVFKTTHISDSRETDESEELQLKEYRIVLVGRTGEGKSSTANSIFGSKIFEARLGAGSVTIECAFHKDCVQGHKILLVDTPGLFDTNRTNDEIKEEICKFIAVTAPGPHIILVVIRLSRFTEEVDQTYRHICDLFGNEVHQYTILLFTGGDDLEDDDVHIKDFLGRAPVKMQKMLNETHNRYVVFNNKLKGNSSEQQVQDLFRNIEDLISENQGGWYGSETYESAEKALREKEIERRDAIIKQKEADAQKLKVHLRQKQSQIYKLEQEDKRKTVFLENRDKQLIQLEREYQEKIKALRDDYESRITEVRDETRKNIKDNNFDVSQPWFKGKLKGAGKKLKKIIGL